MRFDFTEERTSPGEYSAIERIAECELARQLGAISAMIISRSYKSFPPDENAGDTHTRLDNLSYTRGDPRELVSSVKSRNLTYKHLLGTHVCLYGVFGNWRQIFSLPISFIEAIRASLCKTRYTFRNLFFELIKSFAV